MAENATEWFGMRVTPAQKTKIKRLAEKRGATQKDAVLEAIEQALAEMDVDKQSGSALDQMSDLVGTEPDSDAPTDLSTNPDHMEDYGRD